MNYFTLPFLICLLFFGCSSDENKTKTENPQQSNINKSEPKILYTAPTAATVKWTAFKHSKKVPVNGQFDSIFFTGFNDSSSVSDALKGVTFELFTSSTNTKDKSRDYKIINHFFGVLLNPLSIKGKIEEISGSNNGVGSLLLEMNGKQKRQPFSWSIDDYNEFFLKAELNVLDWDVKKALESLNKVCEAKHTGPNDTESILWPTVEVIVLSKLQEIGV